MKRDPIKIRGARFHHLKAAKSFVPEAKMMIKRLRAFFHCLSRYQQGTPHMVKSLEWSDRTPLNPANRITTSYNKQNNYE